MVADSDFAKTTLTAEGCPACGAGIGAGADVTTTVSGRGYELWFVGAQRETIVNGKLAAALDLRTLADRPHLYGLGPLAQLRGEMTIADSRPALARVGRDGMVKVTQSFDNPFIGRRRRPGPGAVIAGGEWVLETTTVRWMKQPVICIAPF